jgi:hypothetical protein
MLMSMASGSAGATLGLAGQAPPHCPQLFQGNIHNGGGLLGQAEEGLGLFPFLLKLCVMIQFCWFLWAALVQEAKSNGISSLMHFLASLWGSP